MEFDKSRVYTSLNADEVKVGSKCIFAQSLYGLRENVKDEKYDKLMEIRSDDNSYRFVNTRNGSYLFAYLIEEPEEKKLLWTDLKVGDVIRSKDGNETAMVTRVDIEDKSGYERHVYAGDEWFNDEYLAEWEKVEE